MAVSEGGTIFISSTNASGQVKNADFVVNVFINVIEVVELNNTVVHCLTLTLKRMCDPLENSNEYV